MSTMQLKTRILPGGRIEVQAPGLVEGQEVTVNIVVEEKAPSEKKSLLENLEELLGDRLLADEDGERPRRRINDILANYPGGRLFKTAAEVDAYLKEERDSWGD